MQRPTNPAEHDREVEDGLRAVGRFMRERLRASPLASLDFDFDHFLAGGKMLRGRAAFRIGPAAGAPRDALLRCAAAVEMVHAASLLHDDVIDGGQVRRGSPAFWIGQGASGAILVGDLLICQALELLMELPHRAASDLLIRMTGEMCRAETEQELLLRGRPTDWETGVRLARSKTGSLFAFVAEACADGAPAALRAALREAGYLAGTAYQLSDDILDLTVDTDAAGKTLGLDAVRAKGTSATARPGDYGLSLEMLGALRERSFEGLRPWPAVERAWREYWERDLGPALAQNVGGAAAAVAASEVPA